MPPPAWPVEGRQFLLERFIEHFVPMAAQEHKHFGFPYPSHNLFLLYRKRYRWLPT
jgi:hypothetical protein